MSKNSLQTADVRSSLSRLGSEYFDRKTRRREQLKTSFQTISKGTQEAEVTLKSQINDLVVFLETLRAKKRRLCLNFATEQEFTNKKLSQLQADLAALTEELNHGEALAKAADTSPEDSEQLKPFLASLRPLEEAIQIVQGEKAQTQQNLDNHQARLAQLQAQHAQLTVQMQENSKQAEVLRGNLIHHERRFEEVRREQPLEFNEIVRELETQRQVQTIQEKKAKQAVQLNVTDRRIAELDRDLAKACEDLHQWERHRTLAPDESSLLKQESALAARCQELGLISLTKAVERAVHDQRIDFQAWIRREQFKLIEEQELDLQEKVKAKNVTFNKRIQELSQIIAQQRHAQTPEASRLLNDAQCSLRQLKAQAAAVNKRYSYILRSIKQWKKISKVPQAGNEGMHWPTDADVIHEFKSEVQNSLWSTESFASLEALVNAYVKALEQRDGLTNTSQTFEVKATSELKQHRKLIKMMESQLKALHAERQGVHNEFISLVDCEKASRKKLDRLKEDSENERRRQIERELEASIKPKLAERQKVHKGFNEAMRRRLYEQEHARLKSEADKAKRTTQKRIEELYNSKSYWESQIHECHTQVHAGMLENLQSEVESVKTEIDSLQQQLVVISEAEDELTAKVESMLESKKRELSRSHSKTVWETGGGLDPAKLDELACECHTKTEILQKTETEARQRQSEHQQVLNSLTEKENRGKCKLNKLQEEYRLVERQKNKAQHLRQKLRDLEKEMATFGLANFELLEEHTDTAQSEEHKEPPSNNSVDEEYSSEESEEAQAIVKKLKLEINVQRQVTNFMGDVMSPISFSPRPSDYDNELQFNRYRLLTEDLTSDEVKVLKAIAPLLNGCELYKKFSKRSVGHQLEFDPILADKVPIENCGYGIRQFQLNRQLTKIEVRRAKCFTRVDMTQTKSAGIESFLRVEQLRGPIIPRHTMEILKAQKRQWITKQVDASPEHEEAYIEMKKSGIIVYQDPAFQARSRLVKFFPFFICLEGTGRVEVVADNYIAFKQWVDGLNALFKHKKTLGRLKHYIQPLE